MNVVANSPESDATKLRVLYERSASALLTAADALVPGSDKVPSRGRLLAEIALVKGLPGPAEHAGGSAMSGADGKALAAALEALGHDPAGAFYTLSRPEAADPSSIARRLRLIIEAVDAPLVVALDPAAAEDLAAAFELPPLRLGDPVDALGRRFVALGGFEESLGDDAAKRRVWKQMQAARPREAVY